MTDILDPGPDEDYKKKTRRNRTTFSNSQLTALEKVEAQNLSVLSVYSNRRCLRGLTILMPLSEKNWPRELV